MLRYDPHNPTWEDKDKFILSKGHSCYALYAALAMAGYFLEEKLWHVERPESGFDGHPKLYEIPGVEASTGALGHGTLFCDGEYPEGSNIISVNLKTKSKYRFSGSMIVKNF